MKQHGNRNCRARKLCRLPVAVSGNSPQPAPTEHNFDNLPKTSAGSPTYPLDVLAALSPDKKYLNVAVVNPADSVQPLDINVTGGKAVGGVTRWEMTGNDLEAANHVGQKPQVEIRESEINNVGRTLPVPPISIDIYRYMVEQTAQ